MNKGILSTIVYTAAFFMFIASVFPFSNIRAEESQFRKQFIENYNGNFFQAQSTFVKKNKDIIEAEINILIAEAMQQGKKYQERMYLLDIANQMATMHISWNEGSEDLLNKIVKLQKEEFAKEKIKTDEIEKVKEVEKVPGNFVMAVHKDEMNTKGLSPVIYPHWIHRSFFRCKVCHEDIFIKKRKANDITQTKITEGKLCGVCHNGQISFNAGAEENCGRCHLFGKPESKPIVDFSYYDSNKFKEIASRIGSEWKPENLIGGKLPVDKLGYINWIEMDKIKAFNPLTSLNKELATGGENEEIRESLIVFQTSSTFMKDVLFSHKIHTTWLKCSLCHPKIFKPELGANRVTMIEMKEGKSCGVCHGNVAFTSADCLRCHNQSRENPPQGVLINQAVIPVPVTPVEQAN